MSDLPAAIPISSADAYFAVVADTYDRLHPVLAGPAYNLGLNMIVDLIPHDPLDEFTCVDLGCGTAECAHRILAHFPNSRAVCIDCEPVMLNLARRKLAVYGNRARILEDDLMTCAIPGCDLVMSSKVFHHLPPNQLFPLFRRAALALSPAGCFILFDHMNLGSPRGERMRLAARRILRYHTASAISEGRATQEEVDARRAFKRQMEAEGKDTEYSHTGEQILSVMSDAGFVETSVPWRMLNDTILMGFTSS